MQRLDWILCDNIYVKKIKHILFFIILFISIVSSLQSQTLGVLPFPIIIDSEPSGEIDVSIDDTEEFLLSLQQLIEKLSPIITSELLNTLDSLSNWISVDDLDAVGIIAAIDNTNLSVSINLNPKQKAIRTISIINEVVQSTKYSLDPADFSFYINFSATQQVKMKTQADSFLQTSPLSLTIKPNIQLNGWLLSSIMKVQTNDDLFRLNSIILQNDFPDLGLQLTAGNIRPDITHFQTYSAAIGILLSNQLSQSSATHTSSFKHNFYLNEKSSVDVYINNNLKKTFLLPSGRYILKDLYISQGINDISLEILPESGSPRTETYHLSYDYGSIPVAKTQYSYGIGYDSWDIDWSKLPVIFGNQKFGITENLTTGFAFQISDTYQFTGIDALWATTIGTFQFSGALSRLNNLGVGSAIYAGYDFLYNNYPKIGLSGTFYSDLFLPNGSTELKSSKPLFSITATAGHTFLSSLGLSGSVTMKTDRNTLALNFSGNLRTSLKVSKSLNVTASILVDKNDDTLNWSGSLLFTYHPNINTTITGSSNIEDGNTNINYYSSPENWDGNGSINTSVSGISPDSPMPENISASENYKTQMFELSFLQQAVLGEIFIDPVTFSTSFTATTALSYADGLFGLSRPISDSFVIVGPKYATEGLTLGVRASDKAMNSSNNIFGTVVIPNITSSANNRIQVDIIDLPSGFEPGQSTTTYRPSRGQGAAFKIGTDALAYAQGRFLYADSEPADLLFGTVSDINDELSKPQYIFTDQHGTFFIYDLKPGKYLIKMDIEGWEEYILDIKPGMSGLLDLGDLYLTILKESLLTNNSIENTYIAPKVVVAEEAFKEVVENQEVLPVIPKHTEPVVIKSVPKDISGRLLYEDNIGVGFCNGGLVKVNDNSFESLYFTTDFDGAFYIDSLPPGEYELTFFYLNQIFYPLEIPDNSDITPIVKDYYIEDDLSVQNDFDEETPDTRLSENTEIAVDLAPDQDELVSQDSPGNLSILLLPSDSAGTVSGQVTDEEGYPLPFLNGRITDSNALDSPIFFSTDFDGIFSIPSFLPGEYNLQLFYYEIMEYQLIIPIQTANPQRIDIVRYDDIINI